MNPWPITRSHLIAHNSSIQLIISYQFSISLSQRPPPHHNSHLRWSTWHMYFLPHHHSQCQLLRSWSWIPWILTWFEGTCMMASSTSFWIWKPMDATTIWRLQAPHEGLERFFSPCSWLYWISHDLDYFELADKILIFVFLMFVEHPRLLFRFLVTKILMDVILLVFFLSR